MEMYDGLIEEAANRIHGLENQIAMTADTRNTIIRANRHAKAVLDIFHDILTKDKLDKRDISLIVDRIIVYENRIDIKLRNDVDALLRCEDEQTEAESANFNEDTKNIESVAEKYKSVAVQSAKNQNDKVFSVNVISGGEAAQNVLAPVTTYALFRDGKFLTHAIQSDKKFLALAEFRTEAL